MRNIGFIILARKDKPTPDFLAQTKTKPEIGNGSTLGFEAKLWLAADKLRNNLDAAKYKHVVLGLIFLKYTSDAFEEHTMEIRCRKSREIPCQSIILARKDAKI